MAIDKKDNKLEREYIIPIREKTRTVPRYKKAKKAVRIVKEFLVKHMKIRDRDLRKVRIDKYLNEALWAHGIKHPPHKIKVKATKEGDIVRAELSEYPQNLKFKKLRNEKINQQAKEAVEKKKSLMDKAKEAMKPGEKTETPKEETEAKKSEASEKEKASAEATQLLEKEMAKKEKHTLEMKPKIEEKSREKKVYNKSSRGH